MTYEDFFSKMNFCLEKNVWKPYLLKTLSYFEVNNLHKLYYVSEGTTEWVIGDKKYISSKNSLILVPANMPVQFKTVSPNIYIRYFVFEAKYNRNSIFDYIDCLCQVYFTNEEMAEIVALFNEAEPNNDNTGISEMLRQTSLVLRILSMYFAKGNVKFRNRPKYGNEVIEKIVAYINANPEKTFSLKELSEIAHVHPSYISRIFKEKTGISPMKYANAVRLNRITYMLAGDSRFCKIAEKFNFSSGEAFSRFVKNNTGMSPAEYRKKYTNTEHAEKV